MKNQSFKVGESVVYDMPDGASTSAVVVSLGLHAVPSPRRYAILRFAAPVNRNQHAIVYEPDWTRLTPFGNNLFLATT